MKKIISMATMTLLAGAMMLPPSTAQADRWYNSRAAWAGYGVTGGLIAGHFLWNRPAHRPVVYQPCHQQPAPYFGDGTYTYRERSVFPFYRSVDAEYIPSLPSAPYGTRPAAVSYAEMRAQQERERPIIINIHQQDGSVRSILAEADKNGEVHVPQSQDTNAEVRDIRYISTTPAQNSLPVRRVAVSNRAGAQVDEAAPRETERREQIRTEQPAVPSVVRNEGESIRSTESENETADRSQDVIMVSNRERPNSTR